VPKRHYARIVAIQLLYSIGYTRQSVEEAARAYSQLEPERKKSLPDRSLQLVRTALEHIREIDARIEAALQNWRPERLCATDRAVLRIACAELFYFEDTPPRVVIDEYIEVAREFGDEEAWRFVNGVLDALFAEFRKEEGGNGGEESETPQRRKDAKEEK